jgi:phosphodiesterase/alkaline phosphatase D-like protein
MILNFFERSRFALALRAAWSLLGGATGLEQPREPYVQGITASSAVICWVSEHPGLGVVEYGKTLELGRKEAEARIDGRHAVALTGLDPGSTYHYRVKGIGGSSTGASAPPSRTRTHASASRWSATAAAGGRDSWQWPRCWKA